MTKKILIAVFAFALGFAGNRLVNPSVKVHAQISSPSYTCVWTVDGATSVNPCAQYIVQVNTQRGAAGYKIYQVESSPFDITGLTEAASGSTGASIQALKPSSSVNTLTVSGSQP